MEGSDMSSETEDLRTAISHKTTAELRRIVRSSKAAGERSDDRSTARAKAVLTRRFAEEALRERGIDPAKISAKVSIDVKGQG